MKTIILYVALGLVLLFATGCPTNVVPTTTRAEAKQACDLMEVLAGGIPSEALFDGFILEAEAWEEDGVTETEYLLIKQELCRQTSATETVRNQCFVCVSGVADYVWN